MTFAHPMLLAIGLGSVALPVLIHILMRRRRRPARWAAMRFLLEAYRRQRRRVRFEQWLLLAARCLIVALAAAAIARPMLPGGDPLLGTRATTLYLVIDNSLSASHGEPGALTHHKAAALDLLRRLDPLRGDRAGVVTLAGPAAGLMSPASSNVQSVAALTRAIEPADSAADLHGALARVAADISQDTPAGSRSVVVVLSEFRAGSAPIDRPLPSFMDSGEVTLGASEPATQGLDNVAIVSIEPLRPILLGTTDTATTQVRVRGVRSGPGAAFDASVPIELVVGDAVAARGTLNFEPGSREAVVALGLDGASLGDLRRDGPGPVVVTARLITPDALWRDDTRRAVIERRESLSVGLIAPRRFGPRPGVAEYRAADWVQTALDPEGQREGGQIRVQPLDPATVDASTLSGLDAVVVAEPQGVTSDGWASLRRFADLGGLVMIFPQPGEGAQVWTDLAIAAMDVAWELPREGVMVDRAPGGPGVPSQSPDAVPSTPGGMVRPETGSPLLAMIDGELRDLLRPIRVRRALPLTVRGDDPGVLLLLDDGRVLAALASPGTSARARGASNPGATSQARGLIVYVGLAMDLAWSDLPTKPLLLPLVQEIVRQGVSSARGGGMAEAGAIPIGAPGAVELSWDGPGAPPPGGDRDVPLQPSGLARQAIRHAGVYRGVDGAGASRGLVIVNPAAAASNTDPRDRSEIEAWLETVGAGRPLWLGGSGSEVPGDSGRPVASSADPLGSSDAGGSRRDWPWLPALFALALVLSMVEAVAARVFSHAPAKGGA